MSSSRPVTSSSSGGSIAGTSGPGRSTTRPGATRPSRATRASTKRSTSRTSARCSASASRMADVTSARASGIASPTTGGVVARAGRRAAYARASSRSRSRLHGVCSAQTARWSGRARTRSPIRRTLPFAHFPMISYHDSTRDGTRDARVGVGPTRGLVPQPLARSDVLAAEELADRLVLEHRLERRGDDRRDRQHHELVERRSAGIGSVLVTTTLSIAESSRRCLAGPEKIGWVASAMTSWRPAP